MFRNSLYPAAVAAIALLFFFFGVHWWIILAAIGAPAAFIASAMLKRKGASVAALPDRERLPRRQSTSWLRRRSHRSASRPSEEFAAEGGQVIYYEDCDHDLPANPLALLEGGREERAAARRAYKHIHREEEHEGGAILRGVEVESRNGVTVVHAPARRL